jgi:hypothetical protein
MKNFKKGDYVNIKGLEQPIIDALVARFKVDYVVTLSCLDFYDGEYQLGFHGGNWDLGTWYEACCNELTVEDVLFRGAPDWAVDVRKGNHTFAWTNADNTAKEFNGKGHHIDRGLTENIIYTRTPTAPEPEKTWHEKGEFPPVGTEVEYYSPIDGWVGPSKVFHITERGVCFVEHKDGRWELSRHPESFRPVQPKPKKIDMDRFVASGILLEDKDDELTFNTNYAIRPKLDYWNAVKGLPRKPVWLDGFNVIVREVIPNGDIVQHSSNYVIRWSNVISISFDSIAEGWES